MVEIIITAFVGFIVGIGTLKIFVPTLLRENQNLKRKNVYLQKEIEELIQRNKRYLIRRTLKRKKCESKRCKNKNC